MTQPKTPTHRSRSTPKTPLTPSIFTASPSKHHSSKRSKSTHPFDTSNNPFTAPKSRPVSPVKRTSNGAGLAVSDSLSRQAGGGVIRKGGVESRLDVVTRDYYPPHVNGSGKPEVKRSKSTPAVVRSLSSIHYYFAY
jgi:cell division cycle protein 20 (cofactor of APC complex)